MQIYPNQIPISEYEQKLFFKNKQIIINHNKWKIDCQKTNLNISKLCLNLLELVAQNQNWHTNTNKNQCYTCKLMIFFLLEFLIYFREQVDFVYFFIQQEIWMIHCVVNNICLIKFQKQNTLKFMKFYQQLINQIYKKVMRFNSIQFI
ncbi:hypothetical protein TTHERM_002653419 (macronuclear) [Tetrahymena thermophila SB210]|uniref:Uncharacterized protein n=1 Tax=Tetrahymena thermophila (strain SB210) TaxID=312017 RepID=W7XHK5_TETTS|nr:hypothetical protein TTHERM_002653419 [Tetrahymena thermophila SB210]EWS76773.1 hypothetical protein TTHERM_002653419 [Tetrahymena thermophila SB210]|eukprot:XP_012650692.1 hypothetical protein TTHERM_002653419 [Tetrahymena thermophila SB210]